MEQGGSIINQFIWLLLFVVLVCCCGPLLVASGDLNKPKLLCLIIENYGNFMSAAQNGVHTNRNKMPKVAERNNKMDRAEERVSAIEVAKGLQFCAVVAVLAVG